MTTLHVHHAFLYISLTSLHDYGLNIPNFTFYGGRKQTTTNGPQETNSRETRLHLTFSGNWNKHDKVEKTRIHYKSDVFAAVAVVDGKAPYQ